MEVIQVQPRDSYLHYINVSTKPLSIHWSFKTKRHNINFGVYKRQPDDDDDLFSPSDDEAPIHHQSSSFLNVKSAATAKLLEQGLSEIVPIQQTHSSRFDVEGSLIATQPGNYVLVFDNTFSKKTPKSLILSVTLSDVPEAAPPAKDASSTSSLTMNGNESYELTGWLLKKRRKKLQGWAKRWCRLSSRGILSYAVSPTSEIRGWVPIPLATITHQPKTWTFHIHGTGGSEEYHLKALTSEDYTHWATHLKQLRENGVARQLDQFETWRLQRHSGHLTAITKSKARADVARGLQASQVVKEKLLSLDQWIRESGSNAMDGWVTRLVQLKQDLDVAVKRQEQCWHRVQDTVWQADPFGLNKALADMSLDVYDDDEEEDASPRRSVDSAVSGGGHFYAEAKVNTDHVQAEVEVEVYGDDADDQEEYDEEQSDLEEEEDKSSWMLDYPTQPHRRSQLPSVAVGEVNSALSIFRKNVGKDLSTIALPVSMNEPISILQRACEELEYSELLDKAAQMETPLERLMYVAVFAITSYASSQYRTGRKPFNPMMNETYESIRPDKGFRFVAEKVCHHPLTIAAHAESENYTYWQCTKVKSKFWGKSMELITEGVYHVQLEGHDDHYTYGKPSSWIRNMFAGEKYIEHAGEMKIMNHTTGDYAVVTFKEGSGGGIFGTPTKRNDIVAQFYHKNDKKPRRRVVGKWSDTLSEEVDMKKGSRQLAMLWTAQPPDVEDYESHYGFTRFCVEMNEITEIEKHHLPITDSRYRPDQRLYELGFVDEADAKKKQIEQKQRDRRNEFDLEGLPWNARWFTLQEDPYNEPGFANPEREERQSWIFNHQYWEARKSGHWPEDMFEIW